MPLSRRDFVSGALATGSLLGLGSLGCASLPGSAADPFRHGVASGDPLHDRVILWTRLSVDGPQRVPVDWTVARDPALRDVVAAGRAPAHAARDHCVKVDVVGLEPGRSYSYRFSALGHESPLGRTRTFPAGRAERFRVAFTSCSNIAFGWFNTYAHMARRADLDAVLHLGDYIYEYANDTYGDGSRFGRAPEPDRELVSLADYRTRYAQYRRDPDLQELHRQHPFISVWDDHEIANNAWHSGAQNHQPETEGDWAPRRAAAVRAYLEWMPIREVHADATGRIYRSFRYGDLVDLVMLDTRLVGRDRQAESGQDTATLRDPARSLLGAPQEGWLLDQLSRSKRRGTPWRVIGQQVMLGQLHARDGVIRNPDQWDGYPESRRRVFEHLAARGIRDNVVLTGDIHSSWAQDVAPDPFDGARYDPATGHGSLAVELVTPAASSPGVRDPQEAAERARRALERHPHLHWVELYHRGYVVLDVTRERAQGEWYFVDTVEERRLGERLARAFRTRRGANHLEPVSAPLAPRPGAAPLAG